MSLGAEIQRIAAEYPESRSAILPALRLAQEEHEGWLPPEALREVADALELAPAQVEAVASFYDMLHLAPVGKHLVEVCTNLSCALLGARKVYERARQALGPNPEGITEDGVFTLREEECLGACDAAPVVKVNFLNYDRLTEDGIARLIESIRGGNVPQPSRGDPPPDFKQTSLVLSGAAGVDPGSGGSERAAAKATRGKERSAPRRGSDSGTERDHHA